MFDLGSPSVQLDQAKSRAVKESDDATGERIN